jgi:two-component system response regulator YesN
MSYAAQQAGAGIDDLSRRQGEGKLALTRSTRTFELQEAFVSSAESLLDSVRRLYAGRPQKLVERACRIIDRDLQDKWEAQGISVTGVADALGISAGHLSRVFKRTTGQTFEHYLMMQRVEAAKRMLLDPLTTIAETAESCGFSDSAYFARVFRKVAGCSPSEYRNNPMRRMQPSWETELTPHNRLGA